MKSLFPHLNVQSTQKLKDIYFMDYIYTIYVYILKFFPLFLDILIFLFPFMLYKLDFQKKSDKFCL